MRSRDPGERDDAMDDSEVLELRMQAERCFRLARQMSNQKDAERLAALGRDYAQRAQKVDDERKEPSENRS